MLNINGLIRHKDVLEKWIYSMKPDVICLNETHVNEDVLDHEISLNYYQHIRTNTTNNRTGGVITYVKRDRKVEVLVNSSEVSDKTWMNIIKLKEYDNLVIANVYRSPNSKASQFIKNGVSIFEDYIDKNKILIVGDFNLDISKKVNYYGHKMLNQFAFLGLKQLVDVPTRTTFTSDTLIDLVFANFKLKCEVLLTPKISDHNIIMLNMYVNKKRDEKIKKTITRNFNNLDEDLLYNSLRKNLIKHDIGDIIEFNGTSNINNMYDWDSFIDKFNICVTDALDAVVPKVEKIIKYHWKDKRWISKELVNKMKQRDKLFYIAKSTGRQIDIDNYKKLRNSIVSELRQCKRIFNDKKIDQNKTNSKRLWAELKKLIGDKKSKSIIESIIFDEKVITDSQVIANKFNKYFIESITNIIEDITINKVDVYDINVEYNKYEIWNDFDEVSIEKLEKIINSLDDRKGNSYDINAIVLKCIWKCNKNIIFNIIDKSLKLGLVPKCWKISTIIPIQKTKNSKKAGDFRPINTLPVIEQVLESIVKDQLDKYTETNGILNLEQSGFRKKHSCETAIQCCLIDWRDYIDKRMYIGVVCVDFARAFETINRKMLLHILKELGISGTVLKWFESYLIDRKQIVNFNGSKSDELIVEHGVPQGSKLGPLLFIIYINKVVNIINDQGIHCKLFADDMLIYWASRNVKEIESKINNCMITLTSWLKAHQLKINTNKTVSMLLCDRRKKYEKNSFRIKINNVNILEVTETKYLGIIIDKNLTFNGHLCSITKKIAKKLNIMYRLDNSISSYAKNTIYKAIVSPHLDYCTSLLIDFNKQQLDTLQKVQNRAMRLVLGVNKYTNIVTMLEALGWMTVRQLMVYKCCILIHKMVLGEAPSYLVDKITLISDKHPYNTRQTSLIDIRHSRTQSAKNSLMHSGFNLYNKLPVNIKNEKRLKIFKIELKNYVKVKY